MVTTENFTHVNNDVNGNPRYVIHFLDVLTESEYWQLSNIDERYSFAVKKCRAIGGKKYDTKQFGRCIVFQSYNLQNTANDINELLKQA